VALLLAGLWEAIALFVAACAGLAAPLLAWQWWCRHRQRAVHSDGVQEWTGHVPLDVVVAFWDVGVASAFRFGAGVPVRLVPRPLGLLVEARKPGPRRLPAAPTRAPVLIAWADIAGVRCSPRTRVTGWGRVGVLPFAVVEFDLDGGGVLPFATLEPAGLTELITHPDRPQSGGSAGE
jgi:hypothetical protein